MEASDAVTWGIAGHMALNTVGNLASQSDLEKFLFGRATFVLAVLTAYVAYRGPRTTNAAVTAEPSAAVGSDLPERT